jgi:hypothetical protein
MAETDAIMNKEVDKVGRPCKYESHVQPRLDEIYEWVKTGYTDYSIAEQLGIAHYTLIQYKEKFTELTETYARARKERNNLVMNSMFGKAVGIDKTIPKAFKVKEVTYNEEGKKQAEIERLEYGEETIYVPPDVNAADLFLRNNDPDYKGAKSVESGNITINNFQLPQLEAELQQIAEKRKVLEMQLNQGVYELKDD